MPPRRNYRNPPRWRLFIGDFLNESVTDLVGDFDTCARAIAAGKAAWSDWYKVYLIADDSWELHAYGSTDHFERMNYSRIVRHNHNWIKEGF